MTEFEAMKKERDELAAHSERLYLALLAFAMEADYIPGESYDFKIVYECNGATIEESVGFDEDDFAEAKNAVDDYVDKTRSGHRD